MSNAILLLKIASTQGAGEVLGKTIRAIGRGAQRTVTGAADIGGAAAKELGGPELLGKVVGVGTVGVGGYEGSKVVKRKTDEMRWRMGLL